MKIQRAMEGAAFICGIIGLGGIEEAVLRGGCILIPVLLIVAAGVFGIITAKRLEIVPLQSRQKRRYERMKDREKMEKKIEIYEKALHRIMKIDESSVVRERTERYGYCDDSYELGVAMAIAEIALQEGGL